MDTLCIPKDEALRNQAIEKMRAVYRLAMNVLVLNTELMRASCNRPYTEIFTRITCSSWLRRLWTLQESLLNFNLLFQFSERAVRVGLHPRLYTVQNEDNTQNPWDLVAWECNRYCFHVLMHFPSYSDILQINIIWDALENRTTSKIGDEPLCIAILLDLNIDELQKSPADDKVKKFWSLHDNGLPASVLFIPGTKLPNKGFGWAPADLMQLKVMGSDRNSRAIITRRGLQISYPGFTLSQPDHSPSYVLPCQVDGATFFIRQRLCDGTPSWEGFNLHKCKSLALILLILKGSAERDFSSTVVKGTEETNVSGIKYGLGVLVEGQGGWHGGDRQVKYLRPVIVIRKGSFWDEHPALAWSQTEMEEKERTPVAGVFLPSGQKWCVG